VQRQDRRRLQARATRKSSAGPVTRTIRRGPGSPSPRPGTSTVSTPVITSATRPSPTSANPWSTTSTRGIRIKLRPERRGTERRGVGNRARPRLHFFRAVRGRDAESQVKQRDRNWVGLLGPRRDLHPYFWAGRSSRIVGSGAGTVVPVLLRWRGRSRLGVHRRLLDRWRRVCVIRCWIVPIIRVVPRIRRTPPERGPDPDEDSPVAPTPVAAAPAAVPAPAVPPAAAPPAAAAPGLARRRYNEKKRDRQKG